MKTTINNLTNKLLVAGAVGLGAAQSSAQAQETFFKGVDHVGINVPNLKQAETFFSEIFGFKAVTQLGPIPLNAAWKDLTGIDKSTASVTIKMFHAGTGASIEVFEYHPTIKKAKQPGADAISASHIAFYTDDINASVQYLRSKNVKVLTDPFFTTEGPTAGESWVYFETPWGSRMELVSYPNGKAYEKENPAIRLWSPARETKGGTSTLQVEALTEQQARQLVQAHLKLWNEKDSDKRSSYIKEVYSDELEMVDRHFILRGLNDVNDFIEKLHQLHPDYQFREAKTFSSHNNIIRVYWRFGNDSQPNIIEGMDLFVIENGLVKKLYVFVDKEEK
ncbi:VOC family protein [Desertivirga arenae]|uniref:VOC family protein n=1 Tax=Desertivirga arenae TaxID=2810309 RepID=UPI001A96EA7E|nr:VOC family protein [Pedobacter sp. SYSU D00823]